MPYCIMQTLKALCFIVALAWLGVVFYAQQTCSILPFIGHQCHGPDIDVWILPIVYGLIGLPALVLSAVIIVIAAIERPRRNAGTTNTNDEVG
jgi:hypothetical protein